MGYKRFVGEDKADLWCTESISGMGKNCPILIILRSDLVNPIDVKFEK